MTNRVRGFLTTKHARTTAYNLAKRSAKKIKPYVSLSAGEQSSVSVLLPRFIAEPEKRQPEVGDQALAGGKRHRAIPTVSEWGLIVLTLLALVVGTFLVARRRSVKEAVL